MKIMLPVHHFPPRYNAGAELYTVRLATWLQARGHTVEVVCIEAIDAGTDGALQVTHDQHLDIPVWRLAFNLAAAPEPERGAYDHPGLRAWFDRHLNTSRPDLLHAQAGYLIGVAPLKAAAAHAIPSILTLHDFWFLCPRITLQRGDGSLCAAVPDDPVGCAWCRCLESRRYRWADRASAGIAGRVAQQFWLHDPAARIAARRATLRDALALPAAVIAPSQFLARQFAPYVDADRLIVTRFGLDRTLFTAAASGLPESTLRFGYLGQIAPHKGVHLLIQAFRRIEGGQRELQLHIHGDHTANPTYTRHLRALAGDDARIVFHGRYAHHQLGDILPGYSAVVVPSVWYENSPLTIMEAHAAGIAAITSRLGGMAELVNDEVDGLHFTPGDVADLARQLQRIVDDRALLPRLRAGIVPPRVLDDELEQVVRIYDACLAHQTLEPEALCVSA